MAKTKKVDKPLTSKQKREILEKIEKKTHNQIELSLFYKVSQPTISRIYKDRSRCLNLDNFLEEKFNFRAGKHNDLEALLVKHIKHLRAENFPIPKDIIVQSALKIAKELKISDFKAPNGWFEGFKTRKNIGSHKESGRRKKLTGV